MADSNTGSFFTPIVKLEINTAGDILPSDMYWTGCISSHYLIPTKPFLTILQTDDARIIALLH